MGLEGDLPPVRGGPRPEEPSATLRHGLRGEIIVLWEYAALPSPPRGIPGKGMFLDGSS